MSDQKRITLSFGALSETIKKQLNKQGYDVEKVEHYQKISDSICCLKIMGYITNASVINAEKKLFKNIVKNSKQLSA